MNLKLLAVTGTMAVITVLGMAGQVAVAHAATAHPQSVAQVTGHKVPQPQNGSFSERRGCSNCYKIVTKNGTPTGVGFDADAVGENIKAVINGQQPGRDWIWTQTSSSCPDGTPNCTQGHWKTVGGLRMVAYSCTNLNAIDLSTDTNQSGDTWMYYTDPSGNHYIESRLCYSGAVPDLTGSISTDEVDGHSWDFVRDWFRIQLWTDFP